MNPLIAGAYLLLIGYMASRWPFGLRAVGIGAYVNKSVQLLDDEGGG